MNIPSNYRRVKNNDVIRVGDMFKYRSAGYSGVVAVAIGQLVRHWPEYTFWRARVGTTIETDKPFETKNKNITVVGFYYNDVYRNVQLISLNDAYLKGLEITVGKDKPKYQFKCFLRRRVGTITLLSFGPAE